MAQIQQNGIDGFIYKCFRKMLFSLKQYIAETMSKYTYSDVLVIPIKSDKS